MKRRRKAKKISRPEDIEVEIEDLPVENLLTGIGRSWVYSSFRYNTPKVKFTCPKCGYTYERHNSPWQADINIINFMGAVITDKCPECLAAFINEHIPTMNREVIENE